MFRTPDKNMWVACLLATAERLLKMVVIGQSLNEMLMQTEPPGLSYLVTGGGWLALRYLMSAGRSILALRAGVMEQVMDLQRRQTLFLAGPVSAGSIHETFSLVRTVGERATEARSRLAIELVPGVISALVAAVQLLWLLRPPRSWLCVIFLVASDALHHRLRRWQALEEDRMDVRYNKAMADMYATAMQSMQYQETVAVFDRQHHEMERLRAACERMRTEHEQWSRCWNVQGSVQNCVAHLKTGTALWLAHGHLAHAAQLVVVLFYVAQLQRGIDECRSYQRHCRMWHSAETGLQRHTPAARQRLVGKSETVTDGSVHLRDVDLVRGDATVLRGLCLNVAHGSRVAVLGGNGAGKTSLFRLLQRWHVPTAGTVLSPPAHAVLTCTQEPHLFTNASVPYNVAYGCDSGGRNPSLSTGTAWEPFGDHVVRAAGLLGVSHLAGAAVSLLSGGERQRLGLARVLAAVLERPSRLRLLLLDEHDSALDCRGKALARQAVQLIRQRSGCTVMTILHTPSGTYDTAVIVAAGRVADHGPWEETSTRFFRKAEALGGEASLTMSSGSSRPLMKDVC